MKRTMTILVCVLAGGLARAQSPQIIQNTRATMNTVRENATAGSNAALGINASGQAVVNTAKPSGALAKTGAAPAASASKSSAGAAKNAASAKSVPVIAAKHAAAKKAVAAAPQNKVAAVAPRELAKGTGQAAGSGGEAEPAKKDGEKSDGKWSMTRKRDPFVSPVVFQNANSTCTTGKKCLEIGAINLRGVVRSDSGFIAVVTNSLNKAYFLRENDPVFDGYVVKITGDSIVFQETLQDRLGKTFTREVVKKITTPAV